MKTHHGYGILGIARTRLGIFTLEIASQGARSPIRPSLGLIAMNPEEGIRYIAEPPRRRGGFFLDERSLWTKIP